MVTFIGEDLLILKELFCIHFICHSGGQVQAYIDIKGILLYGTLEESLLFDVLSMDSRKI